MDDSLKIYCRHKHLNKPIESNQVLFVGTSYNRKTKIIEDPECIDMPDLINSDGSLYTIEQEIMKESCLDISHKFILEFIKNLINKEIRFYTVDPTYEANEKKFGDDPPNYQGHYSMLLNELDENVTNKYAVICIMACYNDFFNLNNIDKINKLLDVNGYLIIYDTIQYDFSSSFNQNFVKVV